MISVIIPLYNKEVIIEKSLNSVLSQDYDDFEVIVVNDGSTDKSADIVRNIHDPRVRLIEQENGGPSKARNTGTKNTKGEWIVFLDADDELMPGALRHFHNLIKYHTSFDLFVNSFVLKDINGQMHTLSKVNGEINNPFKLHFLNKLVPHTGSCLISKKMCILCPFNEKLRRYEDFETWFRMYKLAHIYATTVSTFTMNTQYCEASNSRSTIDDDYVGHLSFEGKSFWEKMCLYKLFIEERTRYPERMKSLYKIMYFRIDLFLIYKFYGLINK